MHNRVTTNQRSVKTAQCPYCKEQTTVDMPGDYEPVYGLCGVCGKKFIAERLSEGFQFLTIEEAPCCSDPDCRGIEMDAGDEE